MTFAFRSTAALAVLFGAAGCAAIQHRGDASASRSRSTTRELTKDEQVTHVLSRLTFGARPDDDERVAAIGVDAWIEQQLRPQTVSDTALAVALRPMAFWTQPTSELPGLMAQANQPVRTMQPAAPARRDTVIVRDSAGRIISSTITINGVTGSTSAMAGVAAMRIMSPLVSAVNQFYVGKIIHAEVSERQLFEVITDFWENHFSLFSGKVGGTQALIVWDREVVRPHALGKFRDLLGAVAHSPAMLFYLDNQISTKRGLNENYARELMELHTLGVDGGYSQQDVEQVARALTGWGIGRAAGAAVPMANGAFIFRPEAHDSSQKTVLGHTLAAGRGMEDGEQVLDILAQHPSTARYISFKLARKLVSDDPPAALVARAAATFTRTDGDITEVVRTIVTSPEFFSRAAFRAKVKTPFELVVSARRALNAPPDTTIGTTGVFRGLGQPMFGRQSPDGWPDRGEAWINTGAIKQRMAFGSDLAEGKLRFLPIDQWVGWIRFGNAPVERQADGVVRLLLGGIAPPATHIALRTSTGDPGSRLREMLAIAIASPEFQLR